MQPVTTSLSAMEPCVIVAASRTHRVTKAEQQACPSAPGVTNQRMWIRFGAKTYFVAQKAKSTEKPACPYRLRLPASLKERCQCWNHIPTGQQANDASASLIASVSDGPPVFLHLPGSLPAAGWPREVLEFATPAINKGSPVPSPNTWNGVPPPHPVRIPGSRDTGLRL